MSFILDALKKSESERQRDAAPTLTRAAWAPSRRREPPTWSLVVIGVLLVALLGLGILAWRGAGNPPAAPAATSVPAEPAATAGAAAVPPAPAPAAPVPASREPRPLSDLAAAAPDLPDYALAFVAFDGDDPSRSAAWINGQRYATGDSIGNGVAVSEIRQDSVILSYAGQAYQLRP